LARLKKTAQSSALGSSYGESLRDLVSAITDDRDVRGYLHSSSLGNYDWGNGCHGHGGMLGVDRVTQRHSVRPITARASGIA
jgi:beta-glucosidase/6-phospho-beta-glucosidase/beta-galactosidase